MTIYALESSRAPVGAALLQLNDDAAPQITIAMLERAQSLAAHCSALCDNVLHNAQCELENVDAIAVGLGPGSWTGLRVGLSWAKTLAQTREIALFGVPSFDALAQSAWREQDDDTPRLMLVSAPCRPGEIYAKIYEAHPDYLLPAQEEWIGSEESVLGALWTQALARGIEAPPLLVSASDAGKADDELPIRLQAQLREQGDEPDIVRIEIAHAVAEIALAALHRWENDESDDALSLQPLYLAPSAAERNLLL